MPDYKKELMYSYLIVLTICSSAGLQCWRTLFDNFSVNIVGLEGNHIGMLQSVREIPGFLALLVTYVILIVKEHKLSALSIIILGAGVFFTGLLPSFSGLIFTTMVMSFGFHYYETTNQSLTLQYFDKQTSPIVFSTQRKWGAAANIAVGIIIFIAFAVFLLVKKFGFSVQDITVLFLINNGINFFINPLIGKFIIRFGERKLLSIEYFFLILIFISYAFVDSRLLVGILYIFDHIFFNFATGIKTYFQKIADPEDIAASAAVGFTINHIAAVVLPVIGGMLWMVDYRIPFFAGAFFSIISLCLVQLIKTGHGHSPSL